MPASQHRAWAAVSSDELGISDEVAWYMEDRGFKPPSCVPAIVTPEPSNVRGALFSPERVDVVIETMRRLRHTQARWAGKPLEPDPWQVAYIIAPTFGWVIFDRDVDGYVRIIRKLLVDVPRKNGKSTLVGALGVYLTCKDGEQGAQVITAATTEKQAGYVFSPVRDIARSSPELRPVVTTLAKRIVHRPTESYMEVIASAADAAHGGNVHGGLIDELHLHKTRDLVDAIETGVGARSQPLIVMITTADDGQQGTIYAERRAYLEKVAKRIYKDPSFRGVVFAADKDDDPFAEETLRKANPGYGISPTRKFLKDEQRAAMTSPAQKSRYLRLHLGIRTKQETTYIELDVWDRNRGLVDEDALRGRRTFGGLDLATTSDLCALCWTFPDGEQGFDVLWRHWVPERAFDKLLERTNETAQEWADNGYLTVTPGDVADYDYIREQINLDRKTFKVATIGYDPWNSSQMVNDLVRDGAKMVQLRQGFGTLSPALKQIKHTLLAGSARRPRYRHGGNPLMRWQVDNLAVAMDPAENVKPNKAKSGDKIDGFAAAVDAMAEVMAAKAHLPAPPQTLPEQAGPARASHPALTQHF